MEFHHVDQGGLELLTSSDPPALASQSAGITDVSHRTWPVVIIKPCQHPQREVLRWQRHTVTKSKVKVGAMWTEKME